jgi:hypothetical protein
MPPVVDAKGSCPACKSAECRIVWNADSVTRLAANLVLFPVWSLGGYFGDPRGAYLALRRECKACGTQFVSRRFLGFGR